MSRSILLVLAALLLALGLWSARSLVSDGGDQGLPPRSPGPVRTGPDVTPEGESPRPGAPSIPPDAAPCPDPVEPEPVAETREPETAETEEESIPDGEIPMGPVIFVDGSLLRLAPSLTGAKAEVRIRRMEGQADVPDRSFVAFSLGPKDGILFEARRGIYEVEVAAVKDGVLVRAKRVVSVMEGPVEVGEFDLVPRAGVRARVVDAGGEPVAQARLLVVRPEELAVPGRRIEPGEGGWIRYADLEPGVDHRLVVTGLPDPFEEVVRVPMEPNGTAIREVRWREKLVPVELRFVSGRDGREIERALVRPRIPATGWEWENAKVLGDRILPGTYEFRAGDLAALVSIPSGRPFSATVRLEPRD